jgi:hypothetical protein
MTMDDMDFFGMMNKYDLHGKQERFYYQLLGRLQTDCDYYLGYGNRNAKHLWAGNEKDQIRLMVELYCFLTVMHERPEWIKWSDIMEYHKKMCVEVSK